MRVNESKSISQRFRPILLLLFVIMAFVIGALYQKVQNLERTFGKVALTSQSPSPAPTAQAPQSGKLTADQAAKIPPVTDSDHIRGSTNPKVYLIEYSDFYCSYCKSFHSTAKQIIDNYDSVAWIFRQFPLDQLHPNARAVAEISECVSSLGGNNAFWKFADAVYKNQPADDKAAITLAVNQGINRTSLEKCYSDKDFVTVVEDQMQGGIKAGVTGTPGNYIVNEKGEAWKIPGAIPYTNLEPIIKTALGQ
jgi:protein-disulfide isomerase